MYVTKAERTRQFIVEKTAPLFNIKGFEGTSLSDLTEITGLTKGSIYGNFIDKEEIAAEAFRYAIGKMRSLGKHHIDKATTYKGKLTLLLEFFATYVLNPPIAGGCPLLNNAVEVDDHHTSMRKIVAAELNNSISYISTLLRKGRAKGEFISGINVKEISYVFFCSVEGGIMMSRATKSREPMKAVVKHCKSILNQISK